MKIYAAEIIGNQGTGSFSGSFSGNGSGLTGVVASATPAGPNQSVQFNDAGVTSGSSQLTFNKATGQVSGSFIGDGSGLTNVGGGVTKAFVLAMAAAL